MKKCILLLFLCGLNATAWQAQSAGPGQVLTLAEARQMALQNHPRIIAARYDVGAATEAVKEVRAAELPAATLYGTAAGANTENDRIMAGGLNNPSVYDRIAGGLSVSQLITDFGHTANLHAGAEFTARAETENAVDVRDQVWLQVSTSYFSALAAQAVLQVAQETVHSRQLLLEQVTALATNQLKSALDVSFAQVALEEGRLLLERAQNSADAARAALANNLGLREERPFQLVEPPTADVATNDVDALIQTALAGRPELLALRAQRDAARRFAWSERDARRPVITAEGVIGNSPDHDDRLADNYAAADVNISLPIFSGGLYLARQRRAEMQASAAEEQLRAAEDEVVRAVRMAWLDVNNTRQQLQTTGELVRHATKAYDLAAARYQAGLSSMVELTDAQLSLVSAQIAQANARHDLLARQAGLDYEIGATLF